MSGARERSGAGGSAFGRRLGALALGLALAPLAAELGYRLLRSEALGPTTNPAYVVHNAELGWAYRPGSRARHRSDEFDVAVEINSRGFRGDEWELGEQGRRVLVLGDSYAFGWGVEAAERFSAQLEAAGWRAFNAGVSGYGTDQELLLLRRLLPELEPDAVVVVACGNDAFENRSERVYGARKPWFEPVHGRLVLRGQPVPQPWLERVSQLARAWEKRAWERRFAAMPRDPRAERALALLLYRAMRDELPDGVPLLVLAEEDVPLAIARDEPGMEPLDLRPALAAAGEPTRFPRDGHWNAAGHAAVGTALVERLRTLLP